ncbi:hypothetical protein TorRG33x02_327430 [Trema orientale]|uniref:Uncharacterized protein n=1 Tax=Trema orientale TaxID=63057 RepID=A0A2P5BB09_TREOI|nr:hypothetical protein TorRG33x02_327430 [Trema orientale]
MSNHHKRHLAERLTFLSWQVGLGYMFLSAPHARHWVIISFTLFTYISLQELNLENKLLLLIVPRAVLVPCRLEYNY